MTDENNLQTLSQQTSFTVQHQSILSVLQSPPREEEESITCEQDTKENIEEIKRLFCAICHDMVDCYETCVPNTCSHFFCLNCILTWNDVRYDSKMTTKCPLCGLHYKYLVQFRKDIIRYYFVQSIKRILK